MFNSIKSYVSSYMTPQAMGKGIRNLGGLLNSRAVQATLAVGIIATALKTTKIGKDLISAVNLFGSQMVCPKMFMSKKQFFINLPDIQIKTRAVYSQERNNPVKSGVVYNEDDSVTI